MFYAEVELNLILSKIPIENLQLMYDQNNMYPGFFQILLFMML